MRPARVTIWTAGFGVPELAAASGLHTDALGRLLTDETLTSVDDSRIVAAGDAAAPSGQPLRMSCRAAGPLGAQAANTVLSRIAGTEPAVIDQAFAGSCVSLGRHAATIQLARKDDTAVNLLHRRTARRLDQGGDLQGHGVGHPPRGRKPGLNVLAQGRQSVPSSRCQRRRWSRTRDHRAGTSTSMPSGSPICGRCCSRSSTKSSARQPESDDVLQDSYLRWAEVDLATVRDTQVVSGATGDPSGAQRAARGRRRREDYIGPWLPEPLLLDERDASADVVLAESVSMAMLVLLETLTPDERAVFVLREVFGFDYDEIAGAVGKSVAAVRQVAHRAREHVHARRKRFEPVDSADDQRRSPSSS